VISKRADLGLRFVVLLWDHIHYGRVGVCKLTFGENGGKTEKIKKDRTGGS